MTMVSKFAPDFPPKRDDVHFGAGENPYWAIETQAFQAVNHVAKEFDAGAPSRALEALWRFVGQANRFIDQTQPWTMAKAKDPALPHALWCLQCSLWTIARMIAPVLPATSRTLLDWLDDPRIATWPVTAEGRVFPQAPSLSTIPPPSPLFPRLDDKMQAEILRKVVGDAAAAAPAPATPSKPTPATPPPAAAAAGSTITYDDFAKLELRVGTVKEAVKVPKKDKLLHLQVDLGEGKPRSIVAGIAEAFAPDTLIGKQVIVVANLAPRKMAGLVSEGMILAAGEEAILGLSAVDAAVPPGTRVR